MGIKRQIFEALATRLSTLAWVKLVSWEKVRLTESDFQDHEIPCIQMYDTGALNTHQGGRVEARMGIIVELVLKQTTSMVVNQGILFDYVEEIEQLIGGQIDLGVAGVLHLRYVSDNTDLHTINPFYYASLEFEAIYLKSFTGC